MLPNGNVKVNMLFLSFQGGDYYLLTGLDRWKGPYCSA